MKRGYIKRRVGLKQNVRLQQFSKKNRKMKTKVQQGERFTDALGVDFADVRAFGMLPERVSDWPKIVRPRNGEVCQRMHVSFQFCWQCRSLDVPMVLGFTNPLEAHHLFAGSQGKSDELTAIVMLCRHHHSVVNTPELPMSVLLYLKWRFDGINLNWTRLHQLAKQWLPMPSMEGVEQ